MARASTRLYDAFLHSQTWRAISAAFLSAHPHCEMPGCTYRASQVDHVISRASGGSATAPSNLRALCASCHSTKTSSQDRPTYRASTKQTMARGCDANGNPLSPEHHWNKK